MGRVFISHSSADRDTAEAVRDLLEDLSISTWLDSHGIRAGVEYAAEINRAIRASDMVLLILSEKSQESWPVRSEIERAFAFRKPVIVFRIDGVMLDDSMQYYLAGRQIVSGTSTDVASSEMQELVLGIALNLGIPNPLYDAALMERFRAKRKREEVLRAAKAQSPASASRLDALSVDLGTPETVESEPLEWTREDVEVAPLDDLRELADYYRTAFGRDVSAELITLARLARAGIPEAMLDIADHYVSAEFFPYAGASATIIAMQAFMDAAEEAEKSRIAYAIERMHRIGVGASLERDSSKADVWNAIAQDPSMIERCLDEFFLQSPRSHTVTDLVMLANHYLAEGAYERSLEVQDILQLQEFETPEVFQRVGDLFRGAASCPYSGERAVYWYQEAARLGSAEAPASLAGIYRSGDAWGVAPDRRMVALWERYAEDPAFRSTAFSFGEDCSYADILLLLRIMDEDGADTSQEDRLLESTFELPDDRRVRVTELYNAFADNPDDRDAGLVNLYFGRLFQNHAAGHINAGRKAIYWYKRAVEAGNLDAVVGLYGIYRDGPAWGVEGSAEKAEYWMDVYRELSGTH